MRRCFVNLIVTWPKAMKLITSFGKGRAGRYPKIDPNFEFSLEPVTEAEKQVILSHGTKVNGFRTVEEEHKLVPLHCQTIYIG